MVYLVSGLCYLLKSCQHSEEEKRIINSDCSLTQHNLISVHLFTPSNESCKKMCQSKSDCRSSIFPNVTYLSNVYSDFIIGILYPTPQLLCSVIFSLIVETTKEKQNFRLYLSTTSKTSQHCIVILDNNIQIELVGTFSVSVETQILLD